MARIEIGDRLNLKKKKKDKPKFKPFPADEVFKDDINKQEADTLNKLGQAEVEEAQMDKKEESKKGLASVFSSKHAFGKKGKDIEKKALDLTKTVAKAESKGKKGFFDDEAMQDAALGLVPILLGGLLGGTDGALAGVQTAARGFEVQAKEEQAAKELAQDKELKEKELDIKASAEEGKGKLREAQAGLAVAQAAKFDPERLANEHLLKQQEVQSKLSEGLRKEHFQATKEIGTADLLSANGRIKEVANAPASAAGDIALVFNFMKMNDPRSTVREGEFASAENARGVPESVRNMYNKVASGILLTDNQRIDFTNQADNLLTGQLKAQKRIDDRFESLSTQQGINPSLVVDPEFEKIRSQIAKDKQGEQVARQIESSVQSMSPEARKKRLQDLRNKVGK